jgi:hypothetical protein
MAIQAEIVSGVNLFLESGDRGFLTLLKDLERTDIRGQATIRYLMQLEHWPFTPDSEFAGLMNHFFADFPERNHPSPEEYQATTKALIQEAWNYTCQVIVPTPKEPVEKSETKKAPAPRKTSTRKMVASNEEDISGISTDGASERLKKVIGIQRSS